MSKRAQSSTVAIWHDLSDVAGLRCHREQRGDERSLTGRSQDDEWIVVLHGQRPKKGDDAGC
jgi:hypothetical protein